MNPLLQQTLDAAGDDLTQLDLNAAIQNVHDWVDVLGSARLPSESTVLRDLKDLLQRLEGNDLEGLAPLLTKLGGGVTALAGAAPGEDAAGLTKLGEALGNAAAALS